MNFTVESLLKVIPSCVISFVSLDQEGSNSLQKMYVYPSGPLIPLIFTEIKNSMKECINASSDELQGKSALLQKLQNPLIPEVIGKEECIIKNINTSTNLSFGIPFFSKNTLLGVFCISKVSQRGSYRDKQKTLAVDLIQVAANSFFGIKRLIDEGKKEVRRFQLAVDSSPNGIAIFYANQKIDYSNQALLDMSSYDFLEVIDKDFWSCFSHDKNSPGLMDKIQGAILNNQSYISDNFILQKKDNSKLEVRFSLYPVFRRGTG